VVKRAPTVYLLGSLEKGAMKVTKTAMYMIMKSLRITESPPL